MLRRVSNPPRIKPAPIGAGKNRIGSKLNEAARELIRESPFATFCEWSTEADEKAYGEL